MKHFFGPIITFFITHVICCGVLLTLLITSGYLLTIHHIGAEKKFLIPALIIIAVAYYIYREYKKCCMEVGDKTLFNQVSVIFLYFLLSLIIGLVFIVYVFVPWWIPNYTGGPLLP